MKAERHSDLACCIGLTQVEDGASFDTDPLWCLFQVSSGGPYDSVFVRQVADKIRELFLVRLVSRPLYINEHWGGPGLECWVHGLEYASCCPSCDLVLQECRVLSVDVVMVGCTLPLSAREGTLPQPIVLAPVQWMVPDYQDVAKAEQGVALCVGIAVGTRVDVSGEKVSGVQRGCGVWSRFLGRTGGCGAGSLIEARARVLCRRLSLLARVVAQGDPNFGGQPSWVVCIRRGGIWLRRRQS